MTQEKQATLVSEALIASSVTLALPVCLVNQPRAP